MTAGSPLDELVRHVEWADANRWKALLACETAAGDARMKWLLHHIHTVQYREGHAAAGAYLAQADRRELARVVTMPWTEQLETTWNRRVEQPTVEQTVVQVALHSAASWQTAAPWSTRSSSCSPAPTRPTGRRVASGRNTRAFVGSYDFHPAREDGSWRIDQFRFNLQYLDGNLELGREEPGG